MVNTLCDGHPTDSYRQWQSCKTDTCRPGKEAMPTEIQILCIGRTFELIIIASTSSSTLIFIIYLLVYLFCTLALAALCSIVLSLYPHPPKLWNSVKLFKTWKKSDCKNHRSRTQRLMRCYMLSGVPSADKTESDQPPSTVMYTVMCKLSIHIWHTVS